MERLAMNMCGFIIRELEKGGFRSNASISMFNFQSTRTKIGNEKIETISNSPHHDKQHTHTHTPTHRERTLTLKYFVANCKAIFLDIKKKI